MLSPKLFILNMEEMSRIWIDVMRGYLEGGGVFITSDGGKVQ